MKGAVVLTDNHLMGKGICMDGFGGGGLHQNAKNPHQDRITS